jgi:hypothetical protein
MTNFSSEELGFKKISSDNWRSSDPIWDAYWRPESNRLQAWVEDFLAVELEPKVPLEIHRLFEVARGAFVYGVMFYPLVTLGAEQMCRVSEAAVSLKYRSLGAPGQKRKTFANKIKWLIDSGIIKLEDENRWKYLLFFRNEGSHPKNQTILTPVMCLQTMELVAGLISSLFSSNTR